MNPCPIPGCGTYTRYLMCAAHWSLVPADMQLAVNKTWRLLNDRQRKDRAVCAKNYRAARDAALAQVREAVSPLKGVA